MAQTPNSNINLIKFLYKKYRQTGNTVYTDYLSESVPIPASWTGLHPDLLITSGDNTIAVNVETFESLADYKVVEKWQTFLKNSGTELRLCVREDEELKLAKRLARENGIRCDFQRVKKTPPEKRKVRVKSRSRKSLKIDWVILITSLMILSVSLLLFGPMVMKLFKVQNFYQPYDTERQIYKLKRSMKTLER